LYYFVTKQTLLFCSHLEGNIRLVPNILEMNFKVSTISSTKWPNATKTFTGIQCMAAAELASWF